MCGRYAASRSPADLVEEFEVVASDVTESLAPDYNVAPTKTVPAVIERPPRGEPQREAVRRLIALRWGLVPSWAKNPAIGNRLINARMETVADKPAYRRAFAARRALLPADGYYEWYPTQRTNKAGKPLKQPFFIRPKDGGILALAGLYELWRNKEKADDDPDSWLWSATVLTTTAEDAVGHIHDRMPLLVEPERYAAWLDPSVSDRNSLLALLVPAAPGRLEAYPVSTQVNSVRNNGPQLLDPMDPDPEPL
ncbi:MAG: SOS response-associated peptidase [Nocardioidaceae bacterium]|nr:SOS response-associated peptidase [Nocardioidaceae bacterium]